jgi:AAA+ ATPase superfamily predicted ATPase
MKLPSYIRGLNLIRAIHGRHLRQDKEWADPRRILELTGPHGSRKTSTVMEFIQEKRSFYFSFKALDTWMARRLLAERLGGNPLQGVPAWDEILRLLDEKAAETPVLVFDDLDGLASDKDFMSALRAYINAPARRRVFMILIHADTVSGYHLISDVLRFPYCSIAEIKKACPKRTGQEVLELFTLSGGIPEIAASFDEENSVEENLHRMIHRDSPLVCFAEEVLSERFRRPESYAMLLHAIASGHTRISEIGRFSGFPYNKCDKYVKALMAARLVEAVKVSTDSGTKKTSYRLCNPYFHIWFAFIYPNRDRLAAGTLASYFINEALPIIREQVVEEEYVAACFRTLGYRIDCDLPKALRHNLQYRPFTVAKGEFCYTFDFFRKAEGKAVFVKIFHDENQSVGRERLSELEEAVGLCHTFMDSQIYLFSKRRFADSVVHEAAQGFYKLFTVDRLRF